MSSPLLKQIEWLDTDLPEIVKVPLLLEDSRVKNLGIDNMEVPTLSTDYYLDLSKLHGVRNSYPNETNVPSTTSCIVEFGGISMIVEVPRKEMLEAWMYYKRWKNSKNGK